VSGPTLADGECCGVSWVRRMLVEPVASASRSQFAGFACIDFFDQVFVTFDHAF
jgi:hypothetical protein